MRTAGLLISVTLLFSGAGSAHAQVDAHCSARSVSPDAPILEPFILFFDWDSAAITRQAAAILDNVANVLATIPACPILITGNADRSGPADYNMTMSRRRAEAVRAYLRRHGVRAKIDLGAFGETHPLVETADGVREPQNRWADVTIGLNP
ncbi:MAG: flagellar motor protein MotB [Alphaproteobacteria bacterium]|nr:flagellar motor protein MotB [Alphaproteobacteria bacterium]